MSYFLQLLGIGFVDVSQRRLLVSQFPDTDSLANLEAVLLQLGPREVLLPIGGDKVEAAAIKQVSGQILTWTLVAGRGLWCAWYE